MALIVISGFPCSGKTRRADQIKAGLEQRLQDPAFAVLKSNVVVISDDTLNLKREAYSDSRLEKSARGALFTAVQRQLAQDTVVIVDAMNYIKGFRYQMYCAAREAKLRVCTVFVVATPDLCKQWNDERQDGRAYSPEVLDNLLVRYEEPSSMVRWDSPLFTVPWTDEEVPCEDIWQAIMTGNIKPPNAGTQMVPKAPSEALHTLEQTTTSIVSAIMNEQALSQGLGGPMTLSLSPTLKPRIAMPVRNVTPSELQRIKRQFVTVHRKAITLGTTEQGAIDWDERSIADKFVTYLEQNLNR